QGTKVQALVALDGKEMKLDAEKAIIAVGVVGNTENLGLENTKIKIEKNAIKTDAFCQTDEPGVYAIGDVTSPPLLAHKASHEGILAADHLAGQKDLHPLIRQNIPGCTYSNPQIASIGLTEAAAKEQGYQLKIGRFPFVGNGKAIAL